MTSDLSNGLLRELPWDYPAFGLDAAAATITSAVRASMSIPFFYAPVKIKDGHGDDCWFVDGGLLSNFPVTVFDRTDGKPPRWPTFGIKLSARPTANQGVAHHIHGTLSLGEAMITTMTGFYDRMHIDDPSVQDRTIFIDTMNVRATDFDIGPKTQQKLYENGRRAAEMFLDGTSHTPGWNWDDYIAKYGGPRAGGRAADDDELTRGVTIDAVLAARDTRSDMPGGKKRGRRARGSEQPTPRRASARVAAN